MATFRMAVEKCRTSAWCWLPNDPGQLPWQCPPFLICGVPTHRTGCSNYTVHPLPHAHLHNLYYTPIKAELPISMMDEQPREHIMGYGMTLSISTVGNVRPLVLSWCILLSDHTEIFHGLGSEEVMADVTQEFLVGRKLFFTSPVTSVCLRIVVMNAKLNSVLELAFLKKRLYNLCK